MDYHDTDTMDFVVRDGIRFLESLTRHYGTEEGLRIWNGIGEVVGAEVKGKIFFAMLTGESGTRVHMNAGSCTQAVAAIKAIRAGTGWGLKEAKDAWDLSKEKNIIITCSTPQTARSMALELRSIGCVV